MRGVLGPLLMAAGIWLLYGVFTGNLLGQAPPTPPPAPTGSSQTAVPHPVIPISGTARPHGGGPDSQASLGMSDYGNISIGTPGGLPTMKNLYGASQGGFL